jgi:hypothetical protein
VSISTVVDARPSRVLEVRLALGSLLSVAWDFGWFLELEEDDAG